MGGKFRFNLISLAVGCWVLTAGCGLPGIVYAESGVSERITIDEKNSSETILSEDEVIKEIELQNANGIVELDCYEEDLKSIVKFKLDFSNRKVLEPTNMVWHKIMTYKNPNNIRLLLEDKNKNPPQIMTFSNSGEVNSCYYDYAQGHCELFQCYKPAPIFK